MATRCVLSKRTITGDSLSKTVLLEACPQEGSHVSWDDDWASERVRSTIIGLKDVYVRLDGYIEAQDIPFYKEKGWR